MKMAGIDVHKKVLMVVVVDASHAGREAGTATICHAARVSYSDSESGYKSRGWKRR